jgi:hypothetical protein
LERVSEKNVKKNTHLKFPEEKRKKEANTCNFQK